MSYCQNCGREENGDKCSCLRRNPVSKIEVFILYTILLIFPQIGLLIGLNFGLNPNFIGVVCLSIFMVIIILLDLLIHRNYLALFFGCHQRSERSFSIRGKSFPLCARCTGILVGIFIVILPTYYELLPWYVSILFGLPLIIDGLLQSKKRISSNNVRRFVTGLMFAPFIVFLFSEYQILVYNIINYFIK